MASRKKAATVKQGGTPDNPGSICEILKGSEAFNIWIKGGKRGDPEAFIALFEHLDEKDRESLLKLNGFVVNSRESLPARVAKLERENRHLRSLLLTDDLTGLFNKRFFSMQLEMEMARTRRTGQPCSLIIMDFDNFKLINDTLGHGEGDRFLNLMGNLLRDNLRPTDFACRFGGDEFAAIMPVSSLNDSIRIGRRIHAAISRKISSLRWKIKEHLSMSMGAADYEPMSRQTAEDFFKRADRELYRAKRAGKNRISYDERTGRKLTEMTAVNVDERSALMQI